MDSFDTYFGLHWIALPIYHCSHSQDEDDDDDEETKRQTWISPLSFQSCLPANITISQFLKALFWFGEAVPIKTARKNSGMSPKNFRSLYYYMRMLMTVKVQKLQLLMPKLGGPNRIVCIDETYFTQKKRNAAGFVGRIPEGNKTIVLGMTNFFWTLARKLGTFTCL